MPNEIKKQERGKREFLEIDGKKYPMFNERLAERILEKAMIRGEDKIFEKLRAEIAKRFPAVAVKFETDKNLIDPYATSI